MQQHITASQFVDAATNEGGLYDQHLATALLSGAVSIYDRYAVWESQVKRSAAHMMARGGTYFGDRLTYDMDATVVAMSDYYREHLTEFDETPRFILAQMKG